MHELIEKEMEYVEQLPQLIYVYLLSLTYPTLPH